LQKRAVRRKFEGSSKEVRRKFEGSSKEVRRKFEVSEGRAVPSGRQP
jgi:hypothetical protein